jgi:hypothetical protein
MTLQPIKLLRQGDRLWSGLQLGHGRSSYGGAGCLMFDILMAAHALGTRPLEFGPRDANELFKRVGAFRLPDGRAGGSNLVIHIAAAAVGLEAPYAERTVGPAGSLQLANAIERALERGLAILHVDHDRDRPAGDAAADHFVLLLRMARTELGPLELECADPAPREEKDRLVRLAWPELRGLAMWSPKDVRRYNVLGVRPIRRAASAPATLPA